MKLRLLLALPQMPQDPASGAARTAQTACEMAAQSGFGVRALGTTATERGITATATDYLCSAGTEFRQSTVAQRRVLEFTQRGVSYRLLDTGKESPVSWEKAYGRAYDLLFDEELERFTPDLVLTFGGLPGDLHRHRRARQAGANVVFCLFNLHYLHAPQTFRNVSAVLTPSEFLARRYRDEIGLDSVPLPTPVDFDDVFAPARDPVFVTMVNPSIEKGLYFFVRLAEELALRHPEIAVLAVESRGTAGMVVKAGLAGGFDLRRHESVMIAGAVPMPRDIFANTRVLIAPSVVEEASGRVVAEALVNGVPPLVSDRGGMSESCNGAGFVLPLPPDLTLASRKPVEPEAVEAWIEPIARLCFDESFYAEQSARAAAAAEMYRRDVLARRYVEFFARAVAAQV